MKTIWVLLTDWFTTSSFTAPAAQTAHATFFSWSLRFQQGENSVGDSTLDLSALAGPPNGELAPSFSDYTHESGFVLDWMGFPINGTIYLDLPPFVFACTVVTTSSALGAAQR